MRDVWKKGWSRRGSRGTSSRFVESNRSRSRHRAPRGEGRERTFIPIFSQRALLVAELQRQGVAYEGVGEIASTRTLFQWLRMETPPILIALDMHANGTQTDFVTLAPVQP